MVKAKLRTLALLLYCWLVFGLWVYVNDWLLEWAARMFPPESELFALKFVLTLLSGMIFWFAGGVLWDLLAGGE